MSQTEWKAARAKAISDGVTTYDGRPCPKGHGTARYVSNYGCVTCVTNAARKREQKQTSTSHPINSFLSQKRVKRKPRKIRSIFEHLPRTRPEARELGISEYYTGFTCNNGHNLPRLTSTGRCIGCLRNEYEQQFS